MRGEYIADSNAMPARPRKKRRQRRKPIDGRTRTARRIRELAASFLAALGSGLSPELGERCERAAQLVALAEDVRRKALTGRSVSLDDVIRVENAADRARRALGLPTGKREPVYSLADYLARMPPEQEERQG
jgi:hypothetical protein